MQNSGNLRLSFDNIEERSAFSRACFQGQFSPRLHVGSVSPPALAFSV